MSFKVTPYPVTRKITVSYDTLRAADYVKNSHSMHHFNDINNSSKNRDPMIKTNKDQL